MGGSITSGPQRLLGPEEPEAIRFAGHEPRRRRITDTFEREAVERLLAEQREEEIADAYRRAYAAHPQDEALGEAGATLMAESIAELERTAGKRR